jgi:hypothetical protein
MTVLYMKKGDLLPDVTTQLIGPDGQALDLTLATGVTFFMKTKEGRSLVSRAATVVTATEGRVRHTWVAGDTDVEGAHNVEWRAIFPGAKPLTIPGMGFDQIVIGSRLG